jgi:hypothetical protein
MGQPHDALLLPLRQLCKAGGMPLIILNWILKVVLGHSLVLDFCLATRNLRYLSHTKLVTTLACDLILTQMHCGKQ